MIAMTQHRIAEAHLWTGARCVTPSLLLELVITQRSIFAIRNTLVWVVGIMEKRSKCQVLLLPHLWLLEFRSSDNDFCESKVSRPFIIFARVLIPHRTVIIYNVSSQNV